jgi:hypothetical protein
MLEFEFLPRGGALPFRGLDVVEASGRNELGNILVRPTSAKDSIIRVAGSRCCEAIFGGACAGSVRTKESTQG